MIVSVIGTWLLVFICLRKYVIQHKPDSRTNNGKARLLLVFILCRILKINLIIKDFLVYLLKTSTSSSESTLSSSFIYKIRT